MTAFNILAYIAIGYAVVDCAHRLWAWWRTVPPFMLTRRDRREMQIFGMDPENPLHEEAWLVEKRKAAENPDGPTIQ